MTARASSAPLPEQQYKDLMARILEEGKWKSTRQRGANGELLRALTITGGHMRFDVSNGTMPLISLRALGGAFYQFVGELFWILSGNTHVYQLNRYGVKYWDAWAAPEMCRLYGLEPGEFGTTYGHQWRRFSIDDSRQIDQIKRLFDNLRARPDDRRLLVFAWNPGGVDNLVVRPCHGNFQIVHREGILDMWLLQPSADVPVGIPSNMVMYALLLQIIAKATGFKAGELVHNMGDTHMYEDQIPGVKELLKRDARPFPKVEISDAIIKAVLKMVDEGEKDPLSLPEINPDNLDYPTFFRENIKLIGYDPHPPLKRELMPVAI